MSAGSRPLGLQFLEIQDSNEIKGSVKTDLDLCLSHTHRALEY